MKTFVAFPAMLTECGKTTCAVEGEILESDLFYFCCAIQNCFNCTKPRVPSITISRHRFTITPHFKENVYSHDCYTDKITVLIKFLDPSTTD